MSPLPYSNGVLKRSAVHFLIGKVASALLTFTFLLWLVRLLAVEEYSIYVTLVAGTELTLFVTSLGLPWVAVRYLPEFRLYANGKQLTKFALQVIAQVCIYTVLGAVLLFIIMPWLLIPMKLEQQIDIARFYLLVLVLEGLRRNIQECILEPLLLQGQTQFSQVSRNLVLLLCLGLMTTQGTVHLHHVVWAELAGTIAGTTSALYGLFRHLRLYRHLPGNNDWNPPIWSNMWRTGRHMYLSGLIKIPYGQTTFIFLTQHFLGAEATALLGFSLNLYRQISDYLPANLLFSVIRPKLIASYVGENSMAQLTQNANFLGKLSLFILMPLLVCSWLVGDELLSLLSGGKFIQTGYYLGGLLLMLIPSSQTQILATVAVASGRSHLCFWGCSLGVLSLPLAFWLFQWGQGLWSPIMAMLAGQVLFNFTIITSMSFTTDYRPDGIGFFKLVAAAVIGFLLCILSKMAWVSVFQTPHMSDFFGLLNNNDITFNLLAYNTEIKMQDWQNLALTTALSCGFFLLASYFFKPFRVEEQMRLIQLLNNKLK